VRRSSGGALAEVFSRASGVLFLCCCCCPCFFAAGHFELHTGSALPILSDADASHSHLQEIMESLVKDLCDVQTWAILGVKEYVKQGALFCGERLQLGYVQLRVEKLTVN